MRCSRSLAEGSSQSRRGACEQLPVRKSQFRRLQGALSLSMPSRNGWVDKDLTDFTATAGIVLRSGEPGATKFANGFEAAPHVKP